MSQKDCIPTIEQSKEIIVHINGQYMMISMLLFYFIFYMN